MYKPLKRIIHCQFFTRIRFHNVRSFPVFFFISLPETPRRGQKKYKRRKRRKHFFSLFMQNEINLFNDGEMFIARH